ncbi:MAG TPA: hypothetical protein DDW76_04595 [Cyanobacteria bacterium UBA11369]|nr:hypothetical protein [Cyanobacteria bacterium UBA11371]HBE30999.1 hypothetical protein [Cyanobacteria bacterium UBA11368]HBE48087.1 hypothetical protein [Cyanobacteria bacterium UBA11369]
MYKKLLSKIKPLFKPLLIASLVLTLALGHADGALAARSGGRIGGGSFRMPSRTYSPPSRTYAPPGGGYYPYGGGIGFPFLIPFFGIGGGFGGLFTLLIFIAIANFLFQSFRRIGGSETEEITYTSNPTVSVAKLQVGLLANARSLQAELNKIAETADTNSPQGRAEVLQETTLALLRHPEYWFYAGADTQQARLEAAEAAFNRYSLAERSKFTAETLSNVNNLLRQADAKAALPAGETSGELAQLNAETGEYIVVTLLAATLSKLQLPKINSSDDLRQALRQFGAIPSDQLLAIEVLWTPQAEGDTLSSDDMIAEYADLKLI